MWLDGGDRVTHPHGRRWAMAAGPTAYLAISEESGGALFERWAEAVGAPEPLRCEGPPPPFAPHWFGYFTYEAGAFADRIATRVGVKARYRLPLAWWARYPAVLVGRVGEPDVWLVADDEVVARRSLAALLEGAAAEGEGDAGIRASLRLAAPLAPDITRRQYEALIRSVLAAIAAGDIYQANISVHFEAPVSPGGEPLALFEVLRRRRPVPFAALFSFDSGAILSASPECLLSWSADGALASYPIKGTTPAAQASGEGGPTDSDRGRALRCDPKERAEHVMIVDLVRNDLGRVAVPGSVQVTQLARVHRFPGILHLISEVRAKASRAGELAAWVRALFPGGSITGAPKIRAAEIIAELESAPRGVYCGALGYVDRSGGGALNIPIRTAVVSDGRLHVHAGGGIVADSDPENEWHEVLLKASGWAELLGQTWARSPGASRGGAVIQPSPGPERPVPNGLPPEEEPPAWL